MMKFRQKVYLGALCSELFRNDLVNNILSRNAVQSRKCVFFSDPDYRYVYKDWMLSKAMSIKEVV